MKEQNKLHRHFKRAPPGGHAQQSSRNCATFFIPKLDLYDPACLKYDFLFSYAVYFQTESECCKTANMPFKVFGSQL